MKRREKKSTLHKNTMQSSSSYLECSPITDFYKRCQNLPRNIRSPQKYSKLDMTSKKGEKLDELCTKIRVTSSNILLQNLILHIF
jgi:hypothetical protein